MDRVLNKGTLTVRQRGKILRQTILCDYNNEKQVKETVPSWSQNWLLCCMSLGGQLHVRHNDDPTKVREWLWPHLDPDDRFQG